MDDRDIDRIASRIVQKMMESSFREAFAEAVARELRLLAADSRADLAQLGERLDSSRF